MTKWTPPRFVPFVIIALVLMASLLAASRPVARAAALAVPSGAPPQNGAWFGATVSLDSRQTPSTFGALQLKLGRVLDIDRDYSNFSRIQPSAQVKWDVANHIIPFLSIDPRTKTGKQISWASIAKGSYDSVIAAQADALAALGSPVLLSFDHEPDHSPSFRSPAHFVAAWRHYVTIFRDHGATNVQFVLILMAKTYGAASITKWYPGDGYVDWVGADGYNSFGCYGGPPSWTDFSTIFSAFNAFAVDHNKPAAVAEWGSVEDPATPGRKAQWITDAAQTIESWPQIKAVSYFDGFGQTGACKWGLGTSPSALAAFKAMSALPYFNPRPTAAITATPLKGPAPLSVTFDLSGSTGHLDPIASWELAFGDGSTPASGSGPPSFVKHTYAVGTYTATLSVADETGQYQVQTTVIAADPPPTVHTGLRSDRTTSGITLSGWVNPNGLHTAYHFEWGTTTAFGSRTAPMNAGNGTKRVRISTHLTGLTAGTLYYWRLVAKNAAGLSVGWTKTFRTVA